MNNYFVFFNRAVFDFLTVNSIETEIEYTNSEISDEDSVIYENFYMDFSFLHEEETGMEYSVQKIFGKTLNDISYSYTKTTYTYDVAECIVCYEERRIKPLACKHCVCYDCKQQLLKTLCPMCRKSLY